MTVTTSSDGESVCTSASGAYAELLRNMFDAAVTSANPARCVPHHLPQPPVGRTIVVGAGKAAAAMARAVEDNWDGPIEGAVVTRYGHAMPCTSIRILEAAHPVPDEAGVAAAAEIMALVSGLTKDDLVICLISGGGSALLSALPKGVTLDEERALAKALLLSGASIDDMNCVRKHLSLIKGGRLAAAAAPARVETLVISDVPGDDPATIASGPTVADPTTRADAFDIIDKYGLSLSSSCEAWLNDPASETPKPGDLPHTRTTVVATPAMALDAAADVGRKAGYTVHILGDAIEGEAAVIGQHQARLALEVRAGTAPASAPCILLSGGETTVTVAGHGRGGRNLEYLLGLLITLDGAEAISALAADTDGIDGSEDNAGAIIDDRSLARAATVGLTPQDFLHSNDAYSFFEAIDDLVVTGPTLTNVNDFRAILVDVPGT
jgi:hydroxypyruvate reductase